MRSVKGSPVTPARVPRDGSRTPGAIDPPTDRRVVTTTSALHRHRQVGEEYPDDAGQHDAADDGGERDQVEVPVEDRDGRLRGPPPRRRRDLVRSLLYLDRRRAG